MVEGAERLDDGGADGSREAELELDVRRDMVEGGERSDNDGVAWTAEAEFELDAVERWLKEQKG